MTRWAIVVAVLVGGLAVIALPGPATGAPENRADVRLSPGAPAQHCARHASRTLRALRHGDQQVVVVVKSFTPPPPPGGTFIVSLLTANRSKRQEITRFSVFPLRAFTRKEPRKQQRFLVSLREHAGFIEDGKPLCLEVAMEGQAGEKTGGAEIAIELEKVPGTP